MSPRTLTSKEAAAVVGITRQTLHSWISRRKLTAPPMVIRNGRAARLWTDSDVARLRRVKDQIYKKGKTGRPRKKKQ